MLYRKLLCLTTFAHLFYTREHKLLFYLGPLFPASLDLGLIHLNHFLVVEILFLASIRTRVARTLRNRLLVGMVTVIPEE